MIQSLRGRKVFKVNQPVVKHKRDLLIKCNENPKTKGQDRSMTKDIRGGSISLRLLLFMSRPKYSDKRKWIRILETSVFVTDC